MNYSIAIDGPAGAGKSTIAKTVAKKLSFVYVDTGAMYRATAYYLLQNKVDTEDYNKVSEACNAIDITIEYKDGEQQVLLNNKNVTNLIRSEEVGNLASVAAKNKDVRFKLVELQRQLAGKTNVIMDGRDIGTYVLPNADLKVYLTAGSGVRAKRRWLELQSKGIEHRIEEIEQDIIDRDYQDMNREFAPLKQAEDAVLLDSSDMNIEEVVDKIIEMYKNRNRDI